MTNRGVCLILRFMETTTTKSVHKFEAAGLGVAPFRCVAVRENNFPLGDGTFKPGGTCDFCSNGIKYEFVIQGATGRTFVVGSDCVAKTGDRGMIRNARQLRSVIETPAQVAKRETAEAARALRVAEWDARREAEAAALAIRQAEAVAANAWILEALPVGDNGFVDSMAAELRNRKFADLSPRQQSVLIDIFGRTFGRRGSKAYSAAVDRAGEYLPEAE